MSSLTLCGRRSQSHARRWAPFVVDNEARVISQPSFVSGFMLRHWLFHIFWAATGKRATYTYLITEEVRGKIEGTREKREEALPEAESSMTG